MNNSSNTPSFEDMINEMVNNAMDAVVEEDLTLEHTDTEDAITENDDSEYKDTGVKMDEIQKDLKMESDDDDDDDEDDDLDDDEDDDDDEEDDGIDDDDLDDMADEEYAKWITDIFNNFDKILNENGVILWNVSYGNEKPNSMWLSLLSLLQNTNFMIADTIIWKKKTALPQNVSRRQLTRICEFVFVICRKNEFKTFNAYKQIKSISKTGQKYYENIYNFIEAPNNDGSCNLNKATYSSDLCVQLLNIYAKKDAIVYDPFMGTGTTAIACEKYGNENMMCIGSELSEAQVEYSKNRLKELRSNG